MTKMIEKYYSNTAKISLYTLVFISTSIILNSLALAAEQKTLKWLFGNGVQDIIATQDFKFSVSGQRIIIKRDNRILISHDFEKPIICAVSNPLFPCIAVFVSSEGIHEIRADYFKERNEYLPLQYSVDSLYFINIPKNIIKLWSPEGDLYFSDWEFDIWSKKGNYVALLQDHFGPIHIYLTKEFMKSFNIPPNFILYGREPDSDDPAKVTKFVGWKSDNILVYSNACCGHEATMEHDILTGKHKVLEFWEANTERSFYEERGKTRTHLPFIQP
jgi:hypothetical protein